MDIAHRERKQTFFLFNHETGAGKYECNGRNGAYGRMGAVNTCLLRGYAFSWLTR